MRLLLTGGSGFIGRAALRQAVERGWEVVVAGRSRPDVAGEFDFVQTDLLRGGAGTALIDSVRPTHLLHLAWNATPGVYWTTLENLDWVASTLQLYRAFLEAEGRRAVFAGSCAEYDWSGPLLDEAATSLTPSTLYGRSKDGLRRVLQAAAEQAGGSWAWGRIFFVYGPGEQRRRLVSDVTVDLLEGRPAETSHGRQQRDFMHVDDVAGAFLAAVESDWSGAFNIATGRCVPVAEVVTEIAKQTGHPELLKLGARAAPANDPPRLEASTDRLKIDLAYTPRFTLESGLKDTVDWWRSELAGTI